MFMRQIICIQSHHYNFVFFFLKRQNKIFRFLCFCIGYIISLALSLHPCSTKCCLILFRAVVGF